MLSSIITEGSTLLNHPHQRQHHHRRHHPHDHQIKSDAFANVCCRGKGNWASLQFRSISDNRITSDHCQCLHSLDCKQPKKYLMLFRATLKKYVRSLLAGLISSHGQEFINFGQHLNGWYCQYYIGNPCLWQDPLLLENYICTYALMNKPDPSFAILSTCQW